MVPAMVDTVPEDKASRSAARFDKVCTVVDEEVQNGAIRVVACSNENVFTGSSKPVVKVWKVAEASVVEEQHLRMKHGAVGSTCVEVAPDRKNIVAVCSDDGSIGLWDLRVKEPVADMGSAPNQMEYKRVGELNSQIPVAWKMKFFQGGERLVSGGPNGTLALWDLRKKGLEREVEPDPRGTLDTFSEQSSPPAKRSRNEVDTASSRGRGSASDKPSPVFSLAVSEGQFIGCGRGSGSISILRLDGYDWAGDINAHHGEKPTSPVRALSFDAAGKLLLSGGDDQHICVLNAAAWARTRGAGESTARVPQIERFSAHKGWVTSLSICPDPSQRLAVSTSWDGTVKLWDYGTHSLLCNYKEPHSDSVFASAFSPFGGRSFFVTVGADAQLTMYAAKEQASGR